MKQVYITIQGTNNSEQNTELDKLLTVIGLPSLISHYRTARNLSSETVRWLDNFLTPQEIQERGKWIVHDVVIERENTLESINHSDINPWGMTKAAGGFQLRIRFLSNWVPPKAVLHRLADRFPHFVFKMHMLVAV
jgi:hypothetical protein